MRRQCTSGTRSRLGNPAAASQWGDAAALKDPIEFRTAGAARKMESTLASDPIADSPSQSRCQFVVTERNSINRLS